MFIWNQYLAPLVENLFASPPVSSNALIRILKESPSEPEVSRTVTYSILLSRDIQHYPQATRQQVQQEISGLKHQIHGHQKKHLIYLSGKDLLARIFQYIDTKTLLNCRATTKTFKHVVEKGETWKSIRGNKYWNFYDKLLDSSAVACAPVTILAKQERSSEPSTKKEIHSIKQIEPACRREIESKFDIALASFELTISHKVEFSYLDHIEVRRPGNIQVSFTIAPIQTSVKNRNKINKLSAIFKAIEREFNTAFNEWNKQPRNQENLIFKASQEAQRLLGTKKIRAIEKWDLINPSSFEKPAKELFKFKEQTQKMTKSTQDDFEFIEIENESDDDKEGSSQSCYF
jgi:hypothetical protein